MLRYYVMTQTVKNLPAVQETQLRFLGQEVPLEKEVTTSSILAWNIPWTEEPGRLLSMAVTESDMTEQLTLHFMLSKRTLSPLSGEFLS